MTESVECVVIGAGVVGLAAARALALAGREVLVLEQEAQVGAHTSSRNSEVIHAGLCYAKGSIRAQLFPDARNQLYAYCADHNVAHKRLGKLVAACSEADIVKLRREFDHAIEAGVDDLRWLSVAEARTLEPELACFGAYLSPSTGIVDSHGLMLAYQSDIENAGGSLALRSRVLSGVVIASGFRLNVGGADPMTLDCRILVNSAGLEAPGLARRIRGIPEATIPPVYLRRGVYFNVAGKPFKRLIYPVKGDRSLGVHAVVDMAGEVRFGPDVEFIDSIDYSVDAARAASFYPAIRKFWRGLPDGALTPGYAGIRPTIAAPGRPPADYLILGAAEHGAPGLVNLFGIDSPGLTASLALADRVLALLGIETKRVDGW